MKQADKGEQGEWTDVFGASERSYSPGLINVWKFRDLLRILVWRDFISAYKQTILGPLWHIVQPLLMSLTFAWIFSEVAKIQVDGIPPILFYLSGIAVWNFFSRVTNATSNCFIANAHIFNKVYFPRIIVPISAFFSCSISLAINLLVFLVFYVVYLIKGVPLQLNPMILWVPIILLSVGLYALSVGLISSTFTGRYRDLTHLVGFGLFLLMYATPIIYPLSLVPQKYQAFAQLNPLTTLVEAFRLSFFDQGLATVRLVVFHFAISVLIFVFSASLFARAEKRLLDTV